MISAANIINSNEWEITSIIENYRGLLCLKAINKKTKETTITEYKTKRYMNELIEKRFKCRYDEMNCYMN